MGRHIILTLARMGVVRVSIRDKASKKVLEIIMHPGICIFSDCKRSAGVGDENMA
jgi:hypothetical protein